MPSNSSKSILRTTIRPAHSSASLAGTGVTVLRTHCPEVERYLKHSA